MTSTSCSAPSASITRRSTPSATPGYRASQRSASSRLLSIGCCGNPRAARYDYLVETLLLFTSIRQFVETIRQLNTFVIDLEAFSHAVTGANLRQRPGLPGK